jgi:hypothetical protein
MTRVLMGPSRITGWKSRERVSILTGSTALEALR